MRPVLLIISLFTSANALLASGFDTSELRKRFHNAVLDEEYISTFVDYVDLIKEPNPIQLAYKAAAEALKAKEEWNPVEKLLYLRKFKRMMTRAIEQDADEVEIRFLRFGVEYNIPDVFGFGGNMSEDKMVIIDSLAQIDRFDVDHYFGIYILTLLSDSGLYTNQEIEFVRSKLE